MKTIEGFRLRLVMGQPTLVGEGIGQVNFNKLLTLNAAAAYLWQSVEQKEFSVDDLARLLTEHYGINLAIAPKDAGKIAQKWITHGLVQK